MRFGDGLEKVQDLLKVERLGTMREGFQGLQSSLETGAGQVDHLSGYYYPVVTFQGWRPHVEDRKFWPEGDKIADGMRKAANGAKAADDQLAALESDLPKLRNSLDEAAR